MWWGLLFSFVVAACAGNTSADSTSESASQAPLSSTAPGSSTPPTTIDPAVAAANAEGRAMFISTTRCGDAGQSVGSGIALSDGRVLTVAHVVAGATEISVIPANERPVPDTGSESDAESEPESVSGTESGSGSDMATATIVAYDPLRDLALLEADLSRWPIPPPPDFEVLRENDAGTIVQGATSGDVTFTVTEKTIIEMDEVRGTRRSRRSGYLVDAVTDRGDSGAGMYSETGSFAGVLFAVSTGDSSRSWANAADEVQAFLDDEAVTGTFACDPEQSKVERQP